MFENLISNNSPISCDIPFLKLHPDAIEPSYATEDDAGMDLYTLEDVIIKAGDTVSIKTGIAMELPRYLKATVKPRSGISLNGLKKAYKANQVLQQGYLYVGKLNPQQVDGNNAPAVEADYVNPIKDKEASIQTCLPYLRVQIGTIDAGYRGDIGIITYNQESYDVLVPRGTKLAQLVIDFNIKGVLKETSTLSQSERGAGGFGHTDNK